MLIKLNKQLILENASNEENIYKKPTDQATEMNYTKDQRKNMSPSEIDTHYKLFLANKNAEAAAQRDKAAGFKQDEHIHNAAKEANFNYEDVRRKSISPGYRAATDHNVVVGTGAALGGLTGYGMTDDAVLDGLGDNLNAGMGAIAGGAIAANLSNRNIPGRVIQSDVPGKVLRGAAWVKNNFGKKN